MQARADEVVGRLETEAALQLIDAPPAELRPIEGRDTQHARRAPR